MVQIVKLPGYRVAEAVMLLMHGMTDYSDDGEKVDSTRILVAGYICQSNQGLHFHDMNSGRMCNVCKERVGGGIRFNYGNGATRERKSDYDFATGHATDAVVFCDYDIQQVYQVARAAMDWLVLGNPPVDSNLTV